MTRAMIHSTSARSGSDVSGPTWHKALAGAVLLILALVLLLPLPEAGAPLLFLALRLLATRYVWAARADAWLRRKSAPLVARWHRLSSVAKSAIFLALVAVAGFGIYEFVAE